MEINSLREYLEQNPKAFGELLADKEGFALLRPHLDRYAEKAIKTYSERHPSDERFAERLQALEAGMDGKLAALRLENHTLKQCHKLGIDPLDVEDLGMSFKDEGDVDVKLGKLGEKVRKREIAEMNERLAGAFKPGAGVVPASDSLRERRLASLSPGDREILEASGELDRKR